MSVLPGSKDVATHNPIWNGGGVRKHSISARKSAISLTHDVQP